MTDLKYAGTGHTFWETELMDGMTLEIRDDGDSDSYIALYFNGAKVDMTTCSARKEMGDEDFERALNDDRPVTATETPGFGDVSFSCDDCHRTFPAADRHEQNGAELCPDCAE